MEKTKMKTFKPQLEHLEDRLVLNAYWFNPSSGSGNYNAASSWHTLNDNGPPAIVAPTSSDAVHFDNTKQCNLSADAAAASAYFESSAPVVNMRGFNWTVSGGEFKFNYGTINFAQGGKLTINAIPAGEWGGSAGFSGYATGAEVKIQGGTLLSINDDTTKVMNPYMTITGVNSELRWTINAGATVDLGDTGKIDLNSDGKINVYSSALLTPTISCTHGTNPNFLTVDGGHLTLNSDQGAGGDAGATFFYVEVPIRMYAGETVVQRGNLEVYNFHITTDPSFTLEFGGSVLLYAGSHFDCNNGGYSQLASGTNLYINPTGVSGGVVKTTGAFAIGGGNLTFNSAVSSQWNMQLNTLSIGYLVNVYMTAGKNESGDEITYVTTATIDGTIHLKKTGVWMVNDTTKLIDANTISGSFSTRYYGWTGAINLDTYFSLNNVSGDLVAKNLS